MWEAEECLTETGIFQDVCPGLVLVYTFVCSTHQTVSSTSAYSHRGPGGREMMCLPAVRQSHTYSPVSLVCLGVLWPCRRTLHVLGGAAIVLSVLG